jgi:4'-phosphopantetheinyl transferase EntD
VGVDIETAEITSRVARFVLDERERETLLAPRGRYTARELFSAKEAGFKALSHVGTKDQLPFWRTELHVRDGAIVARVDGAEARTWVCLNENLSFALAVYP